MNLRQLRKSFLFFAILLVLVIIERLFLTDPEASFFTEKESSPTSTHSLYTFCTKVLNKKPINPIDEIKTRERRIYFFARSPLLEEAQTEMIWYHNNQQVQTIGCSNPTRICYSSLSPKKLKQGTWSVDIIQGDRLLYTGTLQVSDP